MSKVNSTIVLECDHELMFSAYPPKVMESIWCARCEVMRFVKVAPPEYRIRCKGCRLSRPFGKSREDADSLGSRHHAKTGHEVQLVNGYGVAHVWHGTVPSAEVRASVLARLDLEL